MYAAISYGHPLNKIKKCPPSFWQGLDDEIIKRLDGIIVLMLNGWEESNGIAHELELARYLCLPILYVSLEDIPGFVTTNYYRLTKNPLDLRNNYDLNI